MNSQKGFGLLEIALAIILSALLLAFTLREQVDNLKKGQAEARADQILQLQKAVSDYIEQHRSSAVNGLTIVYPHSQTDSEGATGVSATGSHTLLQPSVEQLVLLEMLPLAFQAKADKLEAAYDINLWVEPIGCTGQNCLIEGMIYTREPVRDPGQTGNAFDGDSVAYMLSRLGGYGFASFMAGGELIGAGGSFTLPNPVVDQPPGIVGAMVNTEINRDSLIPVAGLDYCPGGLYYIPKSSSAAAGDFYEPSDGNLQDWVDAKNSDGCILQFDDIPRGFTSMAVDADPPKVGWTRMSCLPDGLPGLVLSDTGPANKHCNGDYNGAASTTTQSIRVTPGST